MITMYERTIEYSNVCLSAQDHEIKFLFQSQLIGYETPNSWMQRMYLVLKRSFEDIDYDFKKCQQTAEALIRSSMKPNRLWRKQIMVEAHFDGHVNGQYSNGHVIVNFDGLWPVSSPGKTLLSSSEVLFVFSIPRA